MARQTYNNFNFFMDIVSNNAVFSLVYFRHVVEDEGIDTFTNVSFIDDISCFKYEFELI